MKTLLKISAFLIWLAIISSVSQVGAISPAAPKFERRMISQEVELEVK